jgi:hypothetical protein
LKANRVEKQYREKAAQFAQQEQLLERKAVLGETIKQCAEEEKKVNLFIVNDRSCICI